MKEYLDNQFWKWQAGDRDKRLLDFATYLGVEYGALSAWMNGTRKPRRENVARLSEKLGLEVYDVAGYARPNNGDIDPDLMSTFIQGWRRFPPDLQRDLEELVTTSTDEEAEAIFRRAVQLWRSDQDGVASDDGDDAPSPKVPAPEKGAGRQQARLRRRADGA